MSGNNGWQGEPRPAFPFYAADWLASERVQAMTLEQQGAYITLLAIQWREGSVSDRIRIRLGSQGMTTEDIDTVFEAFPVSSDDGLRRNLRLERERLALVERREKAILASKKGNAIRWGSQPDPNGIAKRRSSSSSSSISSLSTEKRARKRADPLDVTSVLSEFGALNTPRLLAAITGYLDGRRERKQRPQTARGLRMALKGLSGLEESRAVEVIEAATAGGWLGWPRDATISKNPVRQAGGGRPSPSTTYTPDPTPRNESPPSLSELLAARKAVLK